MAALQNFWRYFGVIGCNMKRDLAIAAMNKLGRQGVPFLFVIDFHALQPEVVPLAELSPQEALYEVNGITNAPTVPLPPTLVFFEKYPLPFEEYAAKCSIVQRHIQAGNSFLTNLTCPTPIVTNLTLQEIFHYSRARYKLWFRDEFVVFSPEIFVQIQNGQIAAFPMKGTIDAALPNAWQRILSDPKETAEHYTIVDLLRNDLSMVARNVQVTRLRYVEAVPTNGKTLLQVSSEIVGQLDPDWRSRLGEILFRLLPAGSISGAPKPQTLHIIAEAEQYDRGYYTGIFGIFDGQRLDSGVMIRFIEKTAEGLIYKSGGGITHQSDPCQEYCEMADKVYLPPAIAQLQTSPVQKYAL